MCGIRSWVTIFEMAGCSSVILWRLYLCWSQTSSLLWIRTIKLSIVLITSCNTDNMVLKKRKEERKKKTYWRGQFLALKTWWLCTHFASEFYFHHAHCIFHHGHCFIKPIYNHEIQRITIYIAMYNFHGFTQYPKTKTKVVSAVLYNIGFISFWGKCYTFMPRLFPS